MSFRETWNSEKSEIFLNPTLDFEEAKKLNLMAHKFARAAHVWIASSGSSASMQNSVKLIALGKRQILNSAASTNAHLRAGPNDRWAQVLPRFHVGGLAIEARAFLAGNDVIDALPNGKWDPNVFTEICKRQKVTLTSLVPAQVFDLINLNLNSPRSLRAIVVGGGALSPAIYQAARELGWPLLPSFGMTETCSQVATAVLQSLDENKFPDLNLLSHLEAKTHGNGALALRGSSLLTGFAQIQSEEMIWEDPKDQDGWLVTEDIVEVDGARLLVRGRRGDFVKILGEGVNLSELRQKLENILLRQNLPIQSATLVARPHARKGCELIMVFEDSINPLAREKSLADFNSSCRPYERIENSCGIAKIPRGDLGKVRFSELAAKLGF